MNELEARVSPNPIFTALLQEDGPESTARQVFGQLEVGHPVSRLVEADVVHDPAPGDQFPFRASAQAGGFFGPRQRFELATARSAAIPVVVDGLISATATGSINLRLRKQVENDG